MPAGLTSARFVGRERELSRIAIALDAAAAGQSRRLLIAGAGGVGVSRLIDESARRVAALADPFAVLRWRAYGGLQLEPYAPVIAGLRRFLASLPPAERARTIGPGSDALAMLIPDLAPERRSGLALRVGPDRRAAATAEAVMGLLERAAVTRPVLLIIEDLHLADAATRALAVFLASVTRPARVCFVATYATDRLIAGDPLLADVAAIADLADPPDRLLLGPLGRDELARLIAGIEGERPTASLLLLAAERSRGNPLLAEEVLVARRELAGVSLGSSLRELVAARLGLRSPECRRTLRLLAPAREPVTRELLQAIATARELDAAGLPPRSTNRPRRGADGLDADLRAGVEEAIEHGFLVEDDEGAIEIRHELIGEAIDADLLPMSRRGHHTALAIALGGRPAAGARHWLAAHAEGAARDAFLEVARLAAARGAESDRLFALEAAMELGAADLEDRAAAGRLLLEAADVAAAAGRPDRCEAYLEAAANRFGERADRAVLAGLHDRLGRIARSLGDHDRALAEHRRAASQMPRDQPVLRARILASLAQTLMLRGTFGEAEGVARQAIAVARSAGPGGRTAEGHATCTLGISRAWSADPATAIGLLEAARDIAREVGEADDYFRAVLNLTTALTLLHRGADAIAVTDEAIEQARQDGLETVYGNTLRGNVAEALFLTGRWAEAREAIRTALEWSPAADAFADAAVTSAMLEVESASDERAARLLGRRLMELRSAPDPQSVVPASRAAASFSMGRGDLGDAGSAADLGWSAVRDTEDWALAARMAATYLEVQAAIVADAQERRALGDVAGARDRARTVLGEVEAVLQASGVPAAAASRAEAEAQLATARAFGARIEGRDTAAAWDAVARAWESVGDPYQVARARWRQAEAALPVGDARAGRAAGRAPLLEAVRIARELGAGPLQRELETLARRALITLPPMEGAPAVPTEPAAAEQAVTVQTAGPSLVSSGPSTQDSDGEPAAFGRQALPAGAASYGTERHEQGSGQLATVRTGAGATSAGQVAAAFVGPPEPPPDAAFGLSNREREVLGLIVLGRTNREIGERLFISQKTVGVHVGNILSKLGVSGRVDAAMVAVRLELVAQRTR
ncbi:MAG: AAA family ATPase [Chloroflexi bacterium]|nr:AAA family ATPase [Chloroflexota bacterium]